MLRWTVHLKGTSPLIQGTSPQIQRTSPQIQRTNPQIQGTSPQTQGATAVAVGQKVYSFLGSYDAGDAEEEHGFRVEVHVFNTVTLRWTKLPPAAAALGGGGGERSLVVEAPSSLWGGRGRCGSAVAIEEVVYVWGRSWRTTDYYDALYAYDAAAHRWRRPRVAGRVPEARDRHSSCALGRALYVCGGYTRWSGRTDSVYRLDTDAMVWSLVAARGTPPPASEVQSATVIGTRMFVLFGAAAASGRHSNVRVFDTESECWLSGDDDDNTPTRAAAPPAEAAVVLSEAGQRRRPRLRLLPGERDGHSAFAYNGELYVLGGESRSSDILWKFNPESFSWSKAEPKGGGGPPPWQTDGMCSVVVGGDRVVLFGGGGVGGGGGGDLFVLDLSPSLKTLSKLALIHHARTRGVPHCVRWELSAMLAPTR